MYVFCFSKYVIDETGGSYMDAVVEILKGLDYSPLYVSLKTGIVATIFSFFLGPVSYTHLTLPTIRLV